MFNLVKNFQYYSKSHSYTGYSITKTVFWKIGVIRRLLGELKGNFFQLFINLENLNSPHKLKIDKPALICAGGPSLNELDENFFEKFSQFGSIFSVNYFPLTKIGSLSRIDYQIFLDDYLVKKTHADSMIDQFYFWKDNIFTGKIIKRVGTNRCNEDSKNFNKEIYLKCLSAPSFTKNINPMKGAVGYPPYSTLFAISAAIWLGYSPIFVSGLDASEHSYLYIEDGKAKLKPRHADKTYPYNNNFFGRPDALSVLASSAFVMESMKLFNKYKVYIVGDQSHIDTLPRLSPAEVLENITYK